MVAIKKGRQQGNT